MTAVFLKPPNHAEDSLFALKRKIFRVLGFASALALPPWYPVAFWKNEPGISAPSGIPRLPQPVLPLKSDGWECKNGVVYLRVHPAPYKEMPFLPVPCPPGCFPGFFMCADEKNTNGKEITDILGEPPALSLRTVYVSFMTIRMDAGEYWWRRVELEIMRESKHHV